MKRTMPCTNLNWAEAMDKALRRQDHHYSAEPLHREMKTGAENINFMQSSETDNNIRRDSNRLRLYTLRFVK